MDTETEEVKRKLERGNEGSDRKSKRVFKEEVAESVEDGEKEPGVLEDEKQRI